MRLDVDTFTDPEVQAFANEHLVSVKINAGDDDGRELFEEFNCEGVPHLIFSDSKGNEIDRIIGYMPPEDYLTRIQEISRNRNTLNNYLDRYTRGENTADVLGKIAGKYDDRGDNKNAANYYKILLREFPQDTSQYIEKAKYSLASLAFSEGDYRALNYYIKQNPDSPYIESALFDQIYHFREAENTEKELDAFKNALVHSPDSPGMLNSYAWRMTELELNLEDALEKVKHAVKLTADTPDTQANIIDTEAEVLWKLNRFDEAVEAIDRAIKIDPESDYFQEQREKFIDAKKKELAA